MSGDSLTVGDLARLLGTTEWRVRRIVDSLATPVPRAGRYRLVPRALIGTIASEVQRLEAASRGSRLVVTSAPAAADPESKAADESHIAVACPSQPQQREGAV